MLASCESRVRRSIYDRAEGGGRAIAMEVLKHIAALYRVETAIVDPRHNRNNLPHCLVNGMAVGSHCWIHTVGLGQ